MTVHADRPAPGVTVKPVVLLDDRFSSEGDMVTVAFNPVSESIVLHVATQGAGTATGLLDETTAVMLATALLKGVVKVDPDDFRVRAAYALLADVAYDGQEAW